MDTPEAEVPPRRPRLATVWLGGCSGCHMSFLDQDHRLFDLAAMAELVYSPFIDVKEFPSQVDVTLVEGAVASDEHQQMIHRVRRATRTLVALGDCAVTGNVTALRNPLGDARHVIAGAYGDWQPQPPLPLLLDQVSPLHQVVPVDFFLPGCPPDAELIHEVALALLAGKTPDLGSRYRFG